MEEVITVLFTLLVALVGSFLAKKLKIPASAMTGAILAVAVLNCLTDTATVPVFTKPCMQVMGGALLGHSISRKDLHKMRSIVKAALILIVAMFAMNVVTGIGVFNLSDMNVATALLATAPGGVSDMALIADDLGANMQIVSILQLFRMFGIYLLFPPVLRYAQKRQIDINHVSEQNVMEKEHPEEHKNIKNCFITLLVAFGGGYLMEQTGIPAGFMIGSVIACAVLNIWKGKGYIPGNWRFYIQSITGAIIGCQMTKESLILLKQLILPVLLMFTVMLVFTFLFGIIMTKISKMDYMTSLLCLTPGGIQETSLLASDMGCDVSCVIVMHTIRLLVVICVFPMILTVLTGG